MSGTLHPHTVVTHGRLASSWRTGGSSNEAGEVVADLRALNAAVTATQLERAMERAALLVADARARFSMQQPGAATAASQGRVRY